MSYNKIALVTGASGGLGKEMAIKLAEKGIDVVITYKTRETEALETIEFIKRMGQNAAAIHLDMSLFKSLDDFVTKFKNTLQDEFKSEGFDFLINNAGMGATVAFENVTEEIFNEFMDVHFRSVFFLTQKTLPLIRTSGRIINISSSTTGYCVPGYVVYASFKGAVEVFTKYLAFELGKKGITANAVAPGPVETDFNNAAIKNNPERKKYLAALSPLNRVGQVDDIGGVIAFLCSEESKWINGQTIKVNGGLG